MLFYIAIHFVSILINRKGNEFLIAFLHMTYLVLFILARQADSIALSFDKLSASVQPIV